MKQIISSRQSQGFLPLAVSMMTCLIVLINVSFKIISLGGMVFAANSLIGPLIASLFLVALNTCTFKEQRHLLNLCLITLYLFCVGVYVLVNLPASEYMHDSPVYQIIFEEIPKKFFATTLSFALSFYLPHLLFFSKTNSERCTPKNSLLLFLLGGLSFFCVDFYFLFSGPHAHSFKQVFIDSLMIASLLVLLIGVIYLAFFLEFNQFFKNSSLSDQSEGFFPTYQYFLCIAVAVMLISLACEYRIVSINKDHILSASCIFFPIPIIISSIIGEYWGYRPNIKLALTMVVAQLTFDLFLMGLVTLPSPPFFNLNPFYSYIMPRRLTAGGLTLFITFFSNAWLIQYLKDPKWGINRPLRLLIANVCANSLLCLVDYSLLYGGIYPYEQIFNLVMNVWQYKLIMTIVLLPFVLWVCKSLERKEALIWQSE
ncbi:VUT family protein [Legionella waltersii]|uniref:VUT family protein n=1 Tax=Legionella waltersii TaxID=66969 RepID=A0A0W1A4U5_9GAMM|nr:VUT family protein [Legionella waltersii]KTD76381.1 hypothetical protein Lwal_2103 [Legionella waltersii]SNV14078.1 Uncharacterized ACR, YhhQ family COG1738 [Legionella waltersii]